MKNVVNETSTTIKQINYKRKVDAFIIYLMVFVGFTLIKFFTEDLEGTTVTVSSNFFVLRFSAICIDPWVIRDHFVKLTYKLTSVK